MSPFTPIVPHQAIGREEALLRAPPGWHHLVHRTYDLLEGVPRTTVGRVLQLQGRLVIACSSRPVPGHVLWRLAAVERLSAHICQVCGLRGRLIPVAESIHWLVDEPHVLCRYHEWRERSGDTIEEMLDERLRVVSRAPDCMEAFLAGDATRIAPQAFREAVVWLGSTEVTLDDSGYVREHRVAWVLQQATAEQLRACEPSDFAPLFTWADPDVREAALSALTLLRPWPVYLRRRPSDPAPSWALAVAQRTPAPGGFGAAERGDASRGVWPSRKPAGEAMRAEAPGLRRASGAGLRGRGVSPYRG